MMHRNRARMPLAKANQVIILLSLIVAFMPNLWAWVPTAALNFQTRQDCRPEVLSQRILKSKNELSWEEKEIIVQNFFNRCEEDLKKNQLTNLVDYVEQALIQYETEEHSGIRKVAFSLPEGHVVKGLLALKKTKEKIPLVIFKCGLSCDIDDPSVIHALIVFFDIGPFHLLVLPSNSGPDFIKTNRVYAVGGIEEGKQIVDIASFIDSGAWEYSNRFSRIHLFGMSLGSHATLYGALYGDYVQRDSNKESLFSSVFAACPVVDFKSSLEHITGESLVAKILRKVQFSHLPELMTWVPFFEKFHSNSNKPFKPSPKEIYEILTEGTIDYYRNKTIRNPWRAQPLDGLKFNDKDTLWNWMDFSKQPVNSLKSPVFVWATENDDVVLFESNSKKLFEADDQLANRKIYKLKTKNGAHCAFPSEFGWGVSSSVMNSLMISKSPELLSSAWTKKVLISQDKIPTRVRANKLRVRTDITFQANVNKNLITLRTQLRNLRCVTGSNRSGIQQSCVTQHTMKFKFEELGLSPSKIPQTKVEAQSLTRWLNSRAVLFESDGSPLSADGNPVGIKWTLYGKDSI